jgi:hypothetical protein
VDEGIREAARAVRPFLMEFLGREVADELDAHLAALLMNAAAEDDVDERLRTALQAHEATQVFLQRVLDDAPAFRPPSVVSETTRAYGGLPGDSSPVSADKFTCPYGDYVTYRMEVGAEVEQCPTHHCPLERR